MGPVEACACADHAWFPLNDAYVGLIDIGDQQLLGAGNWRAHKSGRGQLLYVYRPVQTMHGPRKEYLHRAVLKPRVGMYPDHVNRNGLDNRRSNLREATASQNQANSRTPTGASGVRGVRFHKGRWEARIQVGGVPCRLGSFATKEEAALAVGRERARILNNTPGPSR